MFNKGNLMEMEQRKSDEYAANQRNGRQPRRRRQYALLDHRIRRAEDLLRRGTYSVREFLVALSYATPDLQHEVNDVNDNPAVNDNEHVNGL